MCEDESCYVLLSSKYLFLGIVHVKCTLDLVIRQILWRKRTILPFSLRTRSIKICTAEFKISDCGECLR